MGKKITQYPASAGNPDVTSLIDISEFDGSIYTSKKLSITQLIDFLNTNLNLGSSFTFKNNTGDTISKGMAVELSNAVGLDLPEIQLLSSSFSDVGLSQIFIANEDILNGNSGAFIQNGFLDNYYSVGLTLGQKIFWDVDSQSLTTVGTYIDQVFVGIVTVVDANGQLFVSPTRGTRTLTSQLVNDGSDTINPFITALDVPAVPTLTSELTNDGADTINPFITALDLPTVPTLTSDLTNDGADGLNPFITALDIPTFASADKMVTIGRNSTGSTLYKGTIVYILGSTGNRPNFVKARANIEATSAGTFGVIENDILNNADGNCVTIGAIDNLDTRSSATNPFTVDTLADGDTIYLSPTTAGYITNVKPSAPNHLVYIGKVVRTSPTNGTIVYRIQNGYELEELHNVAISGSLLSGDILQYDSPTSLWKNKVIPTASGTDNGYLTSADWTTFNNKVATTRTLTINGTAQDLSADRSWTIASSAIPQANKIYVDSINGVNLTGRGNINNPYLTPEYALSDITNTGTITATTTNLSATLTAVSSTANIVVGQFITGAGIPYNSIVVSKTVNTIVLNQACTASATITATWFTIYEVILNGNFVVTSNLTKQGFYIVNNGHVIWGNFTLFNLNAIFGIPHKLLGKGDYFGTSSLSVFHDITAQQIAGFTYDLDHGIVDTIGTGYAIHHTSNLGVVNYIGDFVNAKFGYVLYVQTAGFANISFNSYGLLGGIRANTSSCYVTILGNITCPTSILALDLGSSLVSSNCDIVGSTTASRWVHNGNLQGTTHTIGGVTINSGYCSGQIVSSGGHNILNITDTSGVASLSQTATSTVVNNGYIINVSQTAGTLINNGTINTGFLARGTCINNGVISCADGLTIGVGTVFRNFGRIVSRIDTTGAGWRFENMGYLEVSNTNIDLSANGTFVNRGRIYNPSTADDVFNISSSGVVLENYGEIESGTANTTKAIISKSTGTVKLFSGSRLVVANASSPIKCTANTSASKDVYYFSAVTNCNGTTYGLFFAFDGSSFAPNNLVLLGSLIFENTNY